jgi:hypothetical protein
MSTENQQIKQPKYTCNICDYNTSRKFNYDNHLLSSKHQKNLKINILSTKTSKFSKNDKDNLLKDKLLCKNCSKFFKERTGLWKHLKKCENTEKINNCENESLGKINFDTNIILELVKKNQEFQKEMFLDMQKQMFDFMKDKIGDNNSTNIMNNSNNKTFNLQVFLNETCKDAMNITDFVNSIQLQLSDLENVGKVGYIEGISNIIIKNLKALDVEKRPVHCTDQKREVIYVKEDNIWEKEDENNKQLRKAIKLMAHKNICMLKAFRDKYPDFDDGDSRRSTQYNKIVIEAMGGKGDNEYEKDTKIIKKIAKVVGIDK